MIVHTRPVPPQVAIPTVFCWTRFGTEAGESPGRILDRKEAERRANGGLFLWGVGHSLARAISELVVRCPEPEVLFSPIAGPPRREDASPEAVVEWTQGLTPEGRSFPLPSHSRVTSRLSRPLEKACHYALVCFSPEPIPASGGGIVASGKLRNLVSGRPVGASQVSAVVHHDEFAPAAGRVYEVTLRTKLAYPYFLRLWGPIPAEIPDDPIIQVTGKRARAADPSGLTRHRRVPSPYP